MKQVRATLLLALTLLSGCTVFPEAESLKIYQMPAPDLAPSSSEPLPLSLRISTPQAGSVLSSPRMVVNPTGNELQNYKGARWSDPVPALLREHLARAFQQRDILTAVSTDENSLQTDVHLSSDLHRFQVIYGADGPSAVVELNARLIDPNSRKILAGETFVVEQPLTSPEIPDVVEGFKLASDTLAVRLIEWTQRELQ